MSVVMPGFSLHMPCLRHVRDIMKFYIEAHATTLDAEHAVSTFRHIRLRTIRRTIKKAIAPPPIRFSCLSYQTALACLDDILTHNVSPESCTKLKCQSNVSHSIVILRISCPPRLHQIRSCSTAFRQESQVTEPLTFLDIRIHEPDDGMTQSRSI